MDAVRMIYEDGNFRPIDLVDLPEGCPVSLRLIRTVDAPKNRPPIYEFNVERDDQRREAADVAQ
jgi:predicted DNA-binding antitoxin AbrB/MazE fold protein